MRSATDAGNPIDATVLVDTASTDALLDPRCPTRVPEIGEPCAPDQLECDYERCLERGVSDVTFLCNGDSWFFLDRWYCEPNPPGCPERLPAHLSPCDLEGDLTVCRWAPGKKANCVGGLWRVWRADG